MSSEAVDLKAAPILYVDDERNNLIVFKHVFSERFNVLTAQGGEEALSLLAERPIAVLLADQRMPGMSGVELAEQVKLRFPEVVRIILTAYLDPVQTIEAINRGGVTRYIRKPWDPVQVGDILSETLTLGARRHAQRELTAQVVRGERAAMAQAGRDGALHPAGLAVEPVRLGLLLDSVLDLARDEIARRARLHTEIDRELVAEVDPVGMGQALYNLIENAWQALPIGAPARHQVTVALSQLGREVCFSVEDTGGGIPADLRERVCAPFFTTKGPYHSGMGLCVVQAYAEAHGGRVELGQGPGGAKIKLCFPAAQDRLSRRAG